MKKVSDGLSLVLVLMLAWLPLHVHAQAVEGGDNQTSSPPALEPSEDGKQTGLSVTEVRYLNRLDEVIVEHGDGGLREYYEFNDSRDMHQDGSISERGNLRKWRLGGGH